MSLTFDPVAHVYHFDGKRVPGVTEVIASAGLVAGTDWMTEESRIRGTAVHRACELDDALALDESSVDDIVRPYLDAWRALRTAVSMTILGNEERVFHPDYRYAGTLDRRVEMRVGRRRVTAVIDIKSGGRQGATGVQLAAYQKADGRHLAHRFGAYLQADGRYDLVAYDDPTDWPVFLAALSIFNWKARS